MPTGTPQLTKLKDETCRLDRWARGWVARVEGRWDRGVGLKPRSGRVLIRVILVSAI
jgi:hypothetical protein